jgi:hypothetical protein
MKPHSADPRRPDVARGADESVTEIAFAVGFNSSQYFATCFRRNYGSTPGAFRDGQPWTEWRFASAMDRSSGFQPRRTLENAYSSCSAAFAVGSIGSCVPASRLALHASPLPFSVSPSAVASYSVRLPSAV